MTEDPDYKRNIYFPSYSGSNENLINLLKKTSQIICKWFENSHKYGPLPQDNEFKSQMPGDNINSKNDMFSEIDLLLSNSFNPVHPGSLAHLDPPPLNLSILGDLIAASLNNNLLAYELSPEITQLEDSLFKWFSKKIGFNSNSGGIAASGGTLSNLNALITARNYAGLVSNPNSVFLISEDAHSSFIKFTRIMGLRDDCLIRVKTDKYGCMDLNDLKEVIRKCSLEHKKIFSIVATLGTTIRGAIDPIKGIVEICSENNIWLHIDGSIGGIFSITNVPIQGLDYIKYANSITINPQKILGITKTSSFLLVSNLDTLKNTFSTDIPYINSEANFDNRGDLGIQGSRPAEVIKLWLGLRFLGMNSIKDILYSSIERREFFEKNLNTNDFEICSGPLHIISFLPKNLNINDSNIWSLNKTNHLKKSNFILSRPKYKGKYFLRAVMGNYNTSHSHIIDLVNLIKN